MLKKIFYSILFLFLLIGISIYWLSSLIMEAEPQVDPKSTYPHHLPYISEGLPKTRGRILAVVTSTDSMGENGKKTGFDLTELARAYYVFQANGYEVDIASPLGGKPPVVIDNDDMGPFDYAFLNDPIAQEKVASTIPVENIFAAHYQAVYFVGGKGAMFDFPNNRHIQEIARVIYESGGVVSGVCHGPAALVNVELSNGEMLVTNKRVSAFTNDEELFLMPNARDIFPFLLESKLRQQGANVELGLSYLRQVSHDENIVTGQNPWSSWKTSEKVIEQLGHVPVSRNKTPAEASVDVLNNYHQNGLDMARDQLVSMSAVGGSSIDRKLIAMHGVVATMKGDYTTTMDLVRLLHSARD